MRFAKSMLWGISALGLAIGGAFAADVTDSRGSAVTDSRGAPVTQAANEEIWIVQPAIIVSESTPNVVDSSGTAVRDASGNTVTSGVRTTYEEAVVLYDLGPAPDSSFGQSSTGGSVAN
jgi:hypothetical protein